VAPAGTPVRFTGQATAPYVPVNIQIKVRGTTRTIAAITDEGGRFSTTFTPLPTEGGHYTIGACHPGVAAAPMQDEFEIQGMLVDPPQGSVRVVEGTTVQTEFTVQNLSDLPLTNLAATVLGAPANLNVSVALPADPTLGGLETKTLTLTVTAADATVTSAALTLRLTTAEGATLDVPVAVEIVALRSQLVADVGRLDAAVLRGQQRSVQFNVTNQGGRTTGPITVSLPAVPWLSLAGESTLPALGIGQSTTITLLLTPAADAPLTVYNGAVLLRGTDSELSMPFTFRTVSDARGNLLVTVVDEYTLYAEGGPKVAGAAVTLIDAVTGAQVAAGVTDSEGTLAVQQIQEGYYVLKVQAETHDPYQATIFIAADQTNTIEAFVSRQAVKYIWTVTPIQIEDHTQITIEAVFETNVPAPVLTVDPPLIDVGPLVEVGQKMQIDMNIWNHGLIAANDVHLLFPADPYFRYTPLVDNLGTMPAKSSLTIPVTIERIKKDEFVEPCQVSAFLVWSYVVRHQTVTKSAEIPIINRGKCRVVYIPIIPGGGGGGGWWGGGGGGWIQETPIVVYQPDPGVDAQVTLRISQEAVLTRDAFDARLELINSTDAALENTSVTITVTDSTGLDVTNLFGLHPPTYSGFTAVDGSGRVASHSTGVASWILVPSTETTPTNGPTVYYVSGRLSYRDHGVLVSAPLIAVPITVHPQPELDLTYFLHRDVFSDDPWTAAPEPSQPFELSVMVNNKGAGEAKNLHITSAQPEIVDNEKGLLIDFKIITTEVAGQNMVPSLTADFGNIAPGEIKIGTWWMTSTLQGQFIDYKATFQHTDGLGDPRLSLIKKVEIHELIHTAYAYGALDDGKPDFLVNDVADPPTDMPDRLYLSNGDIVPVGLAWDALADGAVMPDDREIELSVFMPDGWGYLRMSNGDPGGKDYRLTAVVRHNPDGTTTTLPVQDFWQTDRTFIEDGQRPIYENNLHMLDHTAGGQYTYTLTYVPRDLIPPMVIYPDNLGQAPRTQPLSSVRVLFSKPVLANTFEVDDLVLTRNGVPVPLDPGAAGQPVPSDRPPPARGGEPVTIQQLGDAEFQINGLGSYTQEEGNYVLAVNMAGITDLFGNAGSGSPSTAWTMTAGRPAVVSISGVAGAYRNTSLDAVEVTFTQPISLATLTSGAVSLTRDGGANLLGDILDVTQTGTQTYRIGSLAGLTAAEGAYTLTVLGTAVQDLDGRTGLGQQSVSWTMDTTAPAVQSLTGPNAAVNTPADSVVVQFSEPIDGGTLSTAALTLTRDGGPDLISSSVQFEPLGGGAYRIAGLSAFDTTDGLYALTLAASSVRDLAGNPGAGSASVQWTMDTVAPSAPTNLAVAPDAGASATDGLTNSLTLTVTGTLPEPGMSVTLIDTSTGAGLGQATVTGTTFSRTVTFVTPGAHVIRAVAADAAGNASQAQLNVFIDVVNPMVAGVTMPLHLTGGPGDKIEVTLTKPMNLQPMIADGTIVSAVTLTGHRAGTVTLPAAAFSYDMAGPTLRISLASLSGALPEDDYDLQLNGSMLGDVAGNALRGGTGGTEMLNSTVFDAARFVQAGAGNLRVVGYSVPALADWNNDGLPDLVVGEKLLTGQGKVRVYLNSGTIQSPVFGTYFYAQSAGADLSVQGAGCLGAFPRVFDWNDDGKKDLVVGQSDGKIALFLNVQTDANPSFAPSGSLEVGLPGMKTPIDVGDRAAFDIVDWNNDGRYDLVVGGIDGKVRLYLNQADSGAADFRNEVLVMDGTNELSVPGGRASVAVTDLNGDGRKDLVLGNTDGRLFLYANQGTDAAPAFNGSQPVLAGGSPIDLSGTTARSRPFVGDFNGDGILDLLLGATDGYVRLYTGHWQTVPGEQFNHNEGPAGAIYSYTGHLVPLAQVTVTPTSGLTTTEAGGTASFTVVLNRRPTADVTIELTSSDASEGTLSATSLRFTPVDWDVPQEVTVTGVDDLVVDGSVNYTINISAAASDDLLYDGMDPPDVALTNIDATRVWTGAGSNNLWSNPANWLGGVPQSGQHLVFAGTARRASVNDLPVGTAFYAVTFADSGFTLAGNSIGLDAQGGTAIRNNFADYGANTIALPIALLSDATISTADGSSSLTFSPTATVNTNGHMLTFDSSSPFNSRFEGVISGSGWFVKNGTAQVDFTAANTYGNMTWINGGSISLSGTGTLGSTAAGTIIADGAFLALVGPVVVPEAIYVSGNGSGAGAIVGLGYARLSGLVMLDGDTRIGVLGPSPTFEISGAIIDGGGGHALTIDGNGQAGHTLVLSGANNYGGATNLVHSATLRLGAANALPVASTLNVEAGSTLDQNGFGGPAGSDVTITDSVRVDTWTGAGANNLWSNPANWSAGAPQAGDHLVFSGTQRQTTNNDLPAGTSFHAITFTRFGFVLTGNAIQLDAAGGTALRNEFATTGASTIALSIALASDAAISTAAGSSRFEFTSAGTIGNGGHVLTIDSSSPYNSRFAGVINGSGALRKLGTSQLDLTAANTYTGQTLLQAGSIGLSGAGTLGTSAGNTVIVDGAVLTAIGPLTVSEPFVVQAPGSSRPVQGVAGAKFTGAITAAADARLGVAGPSPLTEIAGPISSVPGSAVTVQGTGQAGSVVVFSGTNAMSSTHIVDGATMRVGSAGALPSGSAAEVDAGARLDLRDYDVTLGVLSGAGSVALGTGKLTVGAGDVASDFSGSIAGAGSVIKTGQGTVRLFGASTYRGGTTVNQGTLEVHHAQALPVGGSLTIGAGATVVVAVGLNGAIAALGIPSIATAASAPSAVDNQAPIPSTASSPMDAEASQSVSLASVSAPVAIGLSTAVVPSKTGFVTAITAGASQPSGVASVPRAPLAKAGPIHARATVVQRAAHDAALAAEDSGPAWRDWAGLWGFAQGHQRPAKKSAQPLDAVDRVLAAWL
jgi:autotransporter-associated beta strand protein